MWKLWHNLSPVHVVQAVKLTTEVLDAKFPADNNSFDYAIAQHNALDYIFWDTVCQPGWELANWGSKGKAHSHTDQLSSATQCRLNDGPASTMHELMYFLELGWGEGGRYLLL